MTQPITFPTARTDNARNLAPQKETVATYTVVAINRKTEERRHPVDCRVYMGRSRNSSTVYASIWVSGESVHCSGYGSAGGYGYHKESAAIDDAIESAGIKGYTRFHGVGDRAIRDTLLAIAEALYPKSDWILVPSFC